jgi:hypothetical protein
MIEDSSARLRAKATAPASFRTRSLARLPPLSLPLP